MTTTPRTLKLSACVEMIFRELPFAQRLERVAASGLGAFEFWGLGDKDVEGIYARKEELGLSCAAFVGSGGLPLVDRSRRAELLSRLRQALSVAKRLSCPTLIVTAGQELAGISRPEQQASLVAALREAAKPCEDAGVTLVLEPLNVLVDHQGHYLSTSGQGLEILGQVGSPNLKLLYDIYHQQITEGNLIATIEAHARAIGHFHVADVPGRHEPGTGEINYRNVFRAIPATGYEGYIGLEYRPAAQAAETLRAVQALLP